MKLIGLLQPLIKNNEPPLVRNQTARVEEIINIYVSIRSSDTDGGVTGCRMFRIRWFVSLRPKMCVKIWDISATGRRHSTAENTTRLTVGLDLDLK